MCGKNVLQDGCCCEDVTVTRPCGVFCVVKTLSQWRHIHVIRSAGALSHDGGVYRTSLHVLYARKIKLINVHVVKRCSFVMHDNRVFSIYSEMNVHMDQWGHCS